jgi:transcriptional regulator with XRE-family HTH domain
MTTVSVNSARALGPALRQERIQEEISQSALADLAAVGRQWLNAFELGDKPSAPMDMVLRVAAALGVTVVLRPPQPPEVTDDDAPVDLDQLLGGFDR